MFIQTFTVKVWDKWMAEVPPPAGGGGWSWRWLSQGLSRTTSKHSCKACWDSEGSVQSEHLHDAPSAAAALVSAHAQCECCLLHPPHTVLVGGSINSSGERSFGSSQL